MQNDRVIFVEHNGVEFQIILSAAQQDRLDALDPDVPDEDIQDIIGPWIDGAIELYHTMEHGHA